MAVRRLLLLSSSTVHPSGFLEYAKGHIKSFLGPQIKKVLFIPYALHDHDGKMFFSWLIQATKIFNLSLQINFSI
jgi:peptidase E